MHFRKAPLDGEMGFVFTAAGAAYKGMGTELLRAIPELVSPLAENFRLSDVAGWVFDEGDLDPTPGDYLWGTSMLAQAHARLTRGVLTGQWAGWSKASLEDAESALARLRDSRIGLLNAIYAAVIRLIASSWYLIPENALTTGYPGPPKKVTDTTPAAASVKEVTP